ncbi:MAG TPA: shikimate dehydrogenase [Planctomycetaceae bacterium]|nr:shikimate dehydrogenase [Planctomycetaceae bacterium]
MSAEQNFLHELVGSMSQGAAGNPTVAMIEAAFAHHGLHWRYINMEVAPEDLGAAVQGARAMGFRGFNCSLPHKVTVIPHLDGLGESAALMGAVNCVVRRGHKFIGENTDGKGFLKSLTSVVDPRGKSVVMFGAGGAARAIAVELGLAGIRQITVVNRSEHRGRELVDLLRTKLQLAADLVVWNGDYAIPAGTDVVINATSIGLYDANARLNLDVGTLRPGMVVADVIGNPPHTRLIRDAAERGCTPLDGLGMLVNQGVVGVQYWTGVEPDTAVMRRALEQALGL